MLELVPRDQAGRSMLLVVRNVDGPLPHGTVGPARMRFYKAGDHAEALVGIPVEEEPGRLRCG